MKSLLKIHFLILALASHFAATAQNLPERMHFSADGRRLITGDLPSTGLYNDSIIRTIELEFSQPDYWARLTANYASKTDLPATMYVDGERFDSVGVRFKGQTSYQRSGTTMKKSFNISLDYADEKQDVDGYETLNLNNCFEDATFLREMTYLSFNRRHIPAAKAAYVHLKINGQSWGIYPSVQGLNGDFIEEWFLSNDGTRWRAERTTPGGGGMGGPGFGAGTSSLNFLGKDTTLYKPHYTLKTANKPDPWYDLMIATEALNTTPLDQMQDTLKKVFDTDRALWFIAHEILFGDDDGYVNKGGMDYYVYWDKETERLTPLEYDGNSVMGQMTATWTPFQKEADARYPLMNRLFKVPELRQRYLAHLRTLIQEDLDPAVYNAKIDFYYNLIDSFVLADIKKIYSNTEFMNGRNTIKTFLANRRTNFSANAEVNRADLDISGVVFSSNGADFQAPEADETATVTAKIGGTPTVKNIYLYSSTGYDGYFNKTEMFDDGAHGDGSAADGVYGGELQGYPAGTYVRFYIEAIANDGFGTASYMPAGAEHDVFIYRVELESSSANDVVINELMASNEKTVADQDGQYDDWIELYNKSAAAVDLSGWFLTDNPDNLDKWEFPAGTTIPANGYLIVWADENGTQAGLHANFKLSASGETLILLDPSGKVADQVDFGQQTTDKSYSRIPNGTGNFIIKDPTYNRNNESPSGSEDLVDERSVRIFPNPATARFTVEIAAVKPVPLRIFNLLGQTFYESEIFQKTEIETSDWQPGIYLIQIGNVSKKVVVR